MTAAKNLCLNRNVRLNYGSILALREKTCRKCRYCVSRAEKLWLRREEMQLISTVIWNTGSYLKTFESVRQFPPKLLTKSQVTIREPYRQPSIKVYKVLQMQRLMEKRRNATTN